MIIVAKKIYSLLITLALFAGVIGISAQNRNATQVAAPTVAANDPLRLLPASDAVVTVDIKRLINEAMPRVLANDQAKLTKVNAEIDNFKTRTGLDPRSFDRMAVGMHLWQASPGVTKSDTVAIARGSFNSNAIVAAGRLAAKGRYNEQKYNGKTIYVFSINDQMKMFGLLDMRVRDLSVSALDANTLAVGDLKMVHAAIDAQQGRGRVSNELIELATRTPNALIGFGANVPPDMSRSVNVGNDEVNRTIATIRQAYGAVTNSATGFDLLAVARTENASQAKGLADTMDGLKLLVSMAAGQMRGPRGKLAQSVLESLKYSSQGNEFQMSLSVAQADINTLMTTLGASTE